MPGNLIPLKVPSPLRLSRYTPVEMNLILADLEVEFLFNYIQRLQATNMLI